MSIEVLDPSHESGTVHVVRADRLQTLTGTTVGIISNGKYGTKPFFDAFEKELIETYGVARVVRRTKSNYSAPAEEELIKQASQWDALVTGIGD